jgi:hypothetical protein
MALVVAFTKKSGLGWAAVLVEVCAIAAVRQLGWARAVRQRRLSETSDRGRPCVHVPFCACARTAALRCSRGRAGRLVPALLAEGEAARERAGLSTPLPRRRNPFQLTVEQLRS